MADTNLELQTELFQEFEEKKRIKKRKSSASDQGVLPWGVLKETKVILPFDTIVILIIMALFVVVTFYFLGIQKGKKIAQKTVITVEKEEPGTMSSSVVVSKEELKLLTPEKAIAPEKPKATPKAPEKAAVAAIETPKEESSFKKYTIQIGASRDKDAASKDIQELIKSGHDAFIIESSSTKGRTWYKMCIGRFAKSTDAANMMKTLKKEGKKDCFLTHI